MEIFEDDPRDQQALIESLGGAPAAGPSPEEIAKIKALLAAAQAKPTPQPPTLNQLLPRPIPTAPEPTQMQRENEDFRVRAVRDEYDRAHPYRAMARKGLEGAAEFGAGLFGIEAGAAPQGYYSPKPGVGSGANAAGQLISAGAPLIGPAMKFAGGAAMGLPLLLQKLTQTPGLAGDAAGAAKATEAVAPEIGEVLGTVLKTKKAPKVPKPEPFAFAPVGPAEEARMAAMKGETFKLTDLPKQARPTAVHKAILANEGVTVSPVTGQVIEVGKPGPTISGVFPNSNPRTMVIPLEEFTPADVRKFFATNRDVFAKDPTLNIGGWINKDKGLVYLDVSKGFETTREATKFAELQNPGVTRHGGHVKPTGEVRDPQTGLWPQAQEKVFHPESGKELPVGNLYEFINSQEFQDRVHEMAEIGRKAMGGENPEWWNIVNGPMARVYGKENIEALAGYIASTSPQNGPVANMKMASELMRRHLKGETMRQPDWIAPQSAMGKVDAAGNQVFTRDKTTKQMRPASEGFAPSAGQKFPNIGTYAPNAEKVQGGDAAMVTDDKVNDMFHALMGKLVGVFDRHWAKLAEKPEAGIYADAVQNKLEGSMSSGNIEAYPVIENKVRDAAKQAGVDVSKYSAWVWEGIRDTIRKTGKLYGQTHRASAVPETTTGFNQIFENLVSAKAKHLGISVPELEQRLRSGDAELLGLILATPIGAAAYSQWAGGASPSRPSGGGS